MKILIEHHDDRFNIGLSNKEGEAFLTIKGCKIVQGKNGFFVSFPSKKLDSGKYYNHVYASDAFQRVVIAEYEKTKQTKQAKPQSDDEVPF